MTRMKFKLPSLTEDDNEPTFSAQSLFQRHKKNPTAELPKAVSGQGNEIGIKSGQNSENKAALKNSSHSSKSHCGTIEKTSNGVHQAQSNKNSNSNPESKSLHNADNHSNSSRTTAAEVQPQTHQNKVNKNVSSPQKEKIENVPDALPKPGKSNSMLVSPRQRGNPILKFVRNVPWEYGDIVADYEMAPTRCALFLSLRYHNLNPNYIHERLKQLGRTYDLRILLLQIDVKDPYHALKELAKVCILADCTLILAWSQEEAGRYLETYKAFEIKPPDLIMERTEGNYLAKVTETFTSTKKVNKTDAATLITTFGSVENVIHASEEDLSLCPGFGPQKAKRLHDVFHEPFLKSKKRKLEATKEKNQEVETSPTKSPKKGKLTPKKSSLKKS